MTLPLVAALNQGYRIIQAHYDVLEREPRAQQALNPVFQVQNDASHKALAERA